MHPVNLTIKNNTPGVLQYSHAWFNHGGLADGSAFPTSIEAGAAGTAQCSGSLLGCSGWVEYTFNDTPVYFFFSNPAAGANGIDFGARTAIYDDMSGQYYPVNRTMQMNGSNWLTAMIQSTGDSVNEACWSVQQCDVSVVQPANLELDNAQAVWESFPSDGTRSYYKCPEGVPPLSLPASHFKGIASFGNKLIFTHTNVYLAGSQPNGEYLIADKVGSEWEATQGNVDAIENTLHEGWAHPCSTQACGSFMAMGIQQSADGSGSEVSEIQILDIRMAQVNLPIKRIATIARTTSGVNGVGMTKEHGPDGRYIVAGIDGTKLTIYRSTSSDLLNGPVSFDYTGDVNIFDSGPGLGLVTQTNGDIYLFALNADDSGQNNCMNLYQLKNWQGPTVTCDLIGKKNMNIPGMSDSVPLIPPYALLATTVQPIIKSGLVALSGMILIKGESLFNTSFRWGKGLGVTSSTGIEVYASDRDALPLSQVLAAGAGTHKDFSVVTWKSDAPSGVFRPVYRQGDPGKGIGGYDLSSPADLAFPFDYDGSGKLDHLVLYRPGTGTLWILKNQDDAFSPVYQQGDPGTGIGGYDLHSSADRAFAFDYDSSGKLDHLALYRPGTGTMWILKNQGGTFSPVYQQGDPGNGIGGYDLRSAADRALAFDYDGSGKLDHLALYRPGTGTMWILKNQGGTFSPVYQQGDPGNGIGGYDLRSAADRALAFDYDGSGKLDHLALYRPGTGTMWILKNQGGTFSPVYRQGDPGNGIGGYDLRSAADRALAFDYDGSGKLDHLALYRPGTGTIWILNNDGGAFSTVYQQGDPGNGIGGYDLKSPADQVFAFDYDSTGNLDHLVLYRPGTGTIWILKTPKPTAVLAFTVQSKLPWQSTGLTVSGTQITTIAYQSGGWSANPGTGMCDGNGNSEYIAKPYYTLPGAAEGALIGRIGGNVFLVGNLANTPAGVAGPLELCINDDLNAHYGAGLGDNEGSLAITISTQAS